MKAVSKISINFKNLRASRFIPVGCQKNIDIDYTIGYTIFRIGGMTYGDYQDCNINRQTLI